MTAIADANLDAFFRHRAEVPTSCRAALVTSLTGLRGSDDPAVTFGGLPGACVPDFADGCQVELSDGAEPPFRVMYPEPVAVDSGRLLLTPFRGTSYPSYAGLVTLWWDGRTPSESDAVIADLMVRHLVALVDHERLMAAVARAEDRAASLALAAISGRTVSLATGIVMHQDGLAAEEAEDRLRQAAAMTGSSLHEVAASVLRSGALPGRAARGGVRHLGTVR
jgi:ANTAR domain